MLGQGPPQIIFVRRFLMLKEICLASFMLSYHMFKTRSISNVEEMRSQKRRQLSMHIFLDPDFLDPVNADSTLSLVGAVTRSPITCCLHFFSATDRSLTRMTSLIVFCAFLAATLDIKVHAFYHLLC